MRGGPTLFERPSTAGPAHAPCLLQFIAERSAMPRASQVCSGSSDFSNGALIAGENAIKAAQTINDEI